MDDRVEFLDTYLIKYGNRSQSNLLLLVGRGLNKATGLQHGYSKSDSYVEAILKIEKFYTSLTLKQLLI